MVITVLDGHAAKQSPLRRRIQSIATPLTDEMRDRIACMAKFIKAIEKWKGGFPDSRLIELALKSDPIFGNALRTSPGMLNLSATHGILADHVGDNWVFGPVMKIIRGNPEIISFASICAYELTASYMLERVLPGFTQKPRIILNHIPPVEEAIALVNAFKNCELETVACWGQTHAEMIRGGDKAALERRIELMRTPTPERIIQLHKELCENYSDHESRDRAYVQLFIFGFMVREVLSTQEPDEIAHVIRLANSIIRSRLAFAMADHYFLDNIADRLGISPKNQTNPQFVKIFNLYEKEITYGAWLFDLAFGSPFVRSYSYYCGVSNGQPITEDFQDTMLEILKRAAHPVKTHIERDVKLFSSSSRLISQAVQQDPNIKSLQDLKRRLDEVCRQVEIDQKELGLIVQVASGKEKPSNGIESN